MVADASAGLGVAFGILWLLLFCAWIAFIAFQIWCIVDVARRPDIMFAWAQQSKVTWVLVVVLVPFGGVIYWFAARPKLEAVKAMVPPAHFGPPPGYPPPGYGPPPAYGPPPGSNPPGYGPPPGPSGATPPAGPST